MILLTDREARFLARLMGSDVPHDLSHEEQVQLLGKLQATDLQPIGPVPIRCG